MLRNHRHALATALLLLGCSVAIAQSGAPASQAAAPASGVRAEVLSELSGLETHLVRLAEAVPAEKYTWRPAEGVRSISEVFLHAATANFSLPRRLGTPPPAGFDPRGFDRSTTDKAKIVQTLKDSFAHVRQAISNVSDADIEKKVDWIGGTQNTYRGVMIFILRHLGEHLGQSIAYARMNGVVPPWTEEQQQRQQQQQQQKPPEKPKP